MARDSSLEPGAPAVRRPQFAKPCHMVQIDNDQLFAAGRPDRVGPYAAPVGAIFTS